MCSSSHSSRGDGGLTPRTGSGASSCDCRATARGQQRLASSRFRFNSHYVADPLQALPSPLNGRLGNPALRSFSPACVRLGVICCLRLQDLLPYLRDALAVPGHPFFFFFKSSSEDKFFFVFFSERGGEEERGVEEREEERERGALIGCLW